MRSHTLGCVMNLPGEWKTLQADQIESLREWVCAHHSLWAWKPFWCDSAQGLGRKKSVLRTHVNSKIKWHVYSQRWWCSFMQSTRNGVFKWKSYIYKKIQIRFLSIESSESDFFFRIIKPTFLGHRKSLWFKFIFVFYSNPNTKTTTCKCDPKKTQSKYFAI